MTLMTGCISVLLVAALALGVGAVGRAAALDARAQLAADAAALAAVAESVPGGSGRPEEKARLFATANGATIVDCICVPGAAAMQVRVAIDGIVATARAVFEPDLLGPVLPSRAGDDDRN